VTSQLVRGLLAAVGAAALYGCAPVAQSVAARSTPTGAGLGFALTLRLARRPVWLLGLAAEIAAFVLEAAAFSVAPTTLVAPLLACDMLVFVVLAQLAFGTRLSVYGVRGAVAMAAGVALIALAFAHDTQLGRPASAVQLIAFLLAALAAVGVAALTGGRALRAGRPRLAAGVFSASAGACYGLATVATRQIGRTFDPHHPVQLLTTPTPYVLAGCSVLGIGMAQRALQAHPVLAFPLTSAVSALLPVLLGTLLLGDGVPAGWHRLAFVAALALLGVGVALVARDRTATESLASSGSNPD